MSANMRVLSAKLAAMSIPHQSPSAESTALMTSETISTKAIASTMPKERRRERTRFSQPLSCLRAGARQMRSSAFCSSPNTAVAPTSSATVPLIAAITPAPGRSACCRSSSTACARHRIIHEAAGDELPAFVVHRELAEDLPRALRQAALHLSFDDLVFDDI